MADRSRPAGRGGGRPPKAPAGPTRSERDDVRKAREEIRSREELARVGKLGELWANYSLTIVLLILTVATLVAHAGFGWLQYSADQLSHDEIPQLWGDSGYWIYFGEWTLQNWQSEFFQTLVLVVLSAWFVHRGSAESKDSAEQIQAALARIEQRLGRLEDLGTDRAR